MTVEDARALIADLSARGIKIEATSEGNIRYAPRSKIDELTLVQLRQQKQTLVRILTGLPVEDPPDEDVPAFVRKELERASELGLVAHWSRHFGYVTIHDPTAGEWHDLKMKDAQPWAKREAAKRKELRRTEGIARMLSARELEEIWEGGQPPREVLDDPLSLPE